MKGRVLIVAGSDSGGGAGIQADIKAVTALDGFAATSLTALTAQNTEGVFAIHEVPIAFLRQQMEVVLSDIGADCVKTGMLHSTSAIETVVAVLDAHAAGISLVVDPVMVAKGGHALLDPAATGTLARLLIPRATVITPNLPEAEVLTGLEITDRATMETAAERLVGLGPKAVFLKGGHLAGATVIDLFLHAGELEVFESARIETRHTHGTGCTLASAIAAGLAQGLSLRRSAVRARAYVQEAIARAPGFGRGHGPLDHAHTVRSFEAADT